MPVPPDQTPGSDLPHPDLAHLRLPLDQLPNPLHVPPLAGTRCDHFNITLRPPGSKSLTNRALLLAALADGTSTLRHALLDADDAQRMLAAIEQLGAKIEHASDAADPNGPAPAKLKITGVTGRWRPASPDLTLNLNNAGTATRFLAASALLSPTPITIDGNPRMRQRPIGQLISSLRALSATCEELGQPGCPPIRITPPHTIPPAQRLALPTTASSQFISALLLIAPFLPGGLTLTLAGDITSRSYIQMTLGLLSQLGITVKASEDLRIIRICPTSGAAFQAAPNPSGAAFQAASTPSGAASQAAPTPSGAAFQAAQRASPPPLPAFSLDIEPDASSATYFWAAAAITPGASCRIDNLTPASLQPDAHFPQLLAQMGAIAFVDHAAPSTTIRGTKTLEPITADLSLMPDAAMTLAAIACFANGPTTLRGLHTLRHKETDRIAALQNELAKVNVRAELIPGPETTLRITPPAAGLDTSPSAPRIEFDTYDDHRMAMSLALIALRRPNTFIKEPACVRKTYPTFWRDLARLYRP